MSSGSSCCSSARDNIAKIAEQDVFKIIKGFDSKQVKLLREHLLEDTKSEGINIIFEKINNFYQAILQV